MRRSGVVLAVILLALCAVVSAAQARDPLLEQLRLNAADVALAKRIVVHRTDIGATWKLTASGPEQNDEAGCSSFRPDYSAFTITGTATTQFQNQDGSTLLSLVEVYKSRADAVGDFRTGAKPGVARCLKEELEQEFAAVKTITARVVSARMVTAPKVGEHSAAYRVVVSLTGPAGSLNLYVDVLAFQRGRTIGGLVSTGIARRVLGQAALARAVAARMR